MDWRLVPAIGIFPLPNESKRRGYSSASPRSRRHQKRGTQDSRHSNPHAKNIRTDPDIQVEYLAICDAENLEPLSHLQGTAVLLGAMRLGNVRLIDNWLVRCPISSTRHPGMRSFGSSLGLGPVGPAGKYSPNTSPHTLIAWHKDFTGFPL